MQIFSNRILDWACWPGCLLLSQGSGGIGPHAFKILRLQKIIEKIIHYHPIANIS